VSDSVGCFHPGLNASDAQKFLHGCIAACGTEDNREKNNSKKDPWWKKAEGKEIKEACS
jgi:hypothetical protein